MKTIMLAAALVLVAATAHARTWRVNTAGTGDAPTLHAAMDSALAGDIVLAEAGDYLLGTSLSVPPGVTLVGESGPAYTLLYGVDLYSSYATVGLRGGAKMSGVRVRGTTFVTVSSLGAVVDYCIIEAPNGGHILEGLPSTFHNCLLIGGQPYMEATFVQCIIYSGLLWGAIGSTIYLCDVLGDVDPAIDVWNSNYFNFSLDPQFCGVPGSGNYFLQSTSPCLGANNPFEPIPFDIGPLGVGCGDVRVEERTWGSVKALYRGK